LLAKGVFLVGFVGNKGTFQHGLARILTDKDLLFHLGYFGFCVLGLCINELFYSLLVSAYIQSIAPTHPSLSAFFKLRKTVLQNI
jgi:hypothetical protein